MRRVKVRKPGQSFVTERKRVEEKLRESEERYRFLYEESPAVNVIIGIDGKVKQVNRLAAEGLGCSKDEFVGKDTMELVVPEQREEVASVLKRGFRGESTPEIAVDVYAKDRSIHTILFSPGQVLLEKDHSVLFTGMDITERKRVQEALRESEAMYSALVEQAKDVVAIVQDGVVKFANKAVKEFSGFAVEDIVGKPFLNWIVPESRDLVAQRYKSRMTGEKVPSLYAAKIQCKNGAIKDIEVSAEVIQYKGRPADIVIARDVTERKRMETELEKHTKHLEELVEERAKELRATKDRLQFLLSSSPAMIYTSKPYGDLGATFISENFKDILGYEPRELLENPSFWVDHIHPKDRQRVREEELRVIKEGHGSYEYRFQHKDGTYRWMREEARLIRDAAGNPLEVIGYWIDIMNLKRIEDELRERTESIVMLNESISKRLLQKVSQIDNIATVRDRLRKSPDVSTGLDLILDTALKDLEMDVGAVLLIDREESAVKVRGFKSRIEGMRVDESYPPSVGFAELESLKHNKNISKILGQGERSILKTASIHCAPILFGKEVYGILALGRQKDLTLDDSDLAVLGLYAELASTLLETQSLTITPVKEVARGVKRRFELESGSSYLVENDVEKAFEVFADNVLSGLEGLCITRLSPSKVRRKYGLEKTPIVWLTSERAEGEATVHSIQDLSILIANFLEKTKRGVVLLDGLEYLITNHGFELFIRFLQTSRSRFEQKDAILIAPLLEEALDKREVKLIEREMQPLIA